MLHGFCIGNGKFSAINKIYSTAAITGILLFVTACRTEPKIRETEDHKVVQVQKEAVPVESRQFERVKKTGQKDTLTFTLTQQDSVKMELLLPEGKSRNIRINQLIAPDGEMDGPFGTFYSASLKVPGTYKVIIAESLMQENPYEGPYTLKITIGNTGS